MGLSLSAFLLLLSMRVGSIKDAYRSRADTGVFVLDANTSECLHYEAVVGYPPTRHVKIPREVLAEHPEVEIRYDLIDCSIDVCSVEVRQIRLYVHLPQFY